MKITTQPRTPQVMSHDIGFGIPQGRRGGVKTPALGRVTAAVADRRPEQARAGRQGCCQRSCGAGGNSARNDTTGWRTRGTPQLPMLVRLGMRREGHLRESTWAEGEWTDDLLYPGPAREWR
jgi:hypothetical protein